VVRVEACDSAGQPWAGRQFDNNVNADDDGRAPAQLHDAMVRFASRTAEAAMVVDALHDSRLLVPLVARLGQSGSDERELGTDKSHELSIVAVAGPDGRDVLPVFTSVDAMRTWNVSARPVPVRARQVALAAVQEGIELIVIDPTSDIEFVLRRPVVWAIARSEAWVPPSDDPHVVHEFESSVRRERGVLSVHLADGDPAARLRGPELVVRVGLATGFTRSELDELAARLQFTWARSAVISEKVDSLHMELVAEA